MMRITHPRPIAVAALLLLTPMAPRASGVEAAPGLAEGIIVIDFATGPKGAFHALTAVGTLRRGTTSTVRIIKASIDQVPDALVSVAGGASLSGPISRGQTSAGIGLVQMTVAVPEAQPVGSTVTVVVGPANRFPFRVVRTGQIRSIAFNPNPTTVQAGVPFRIDVQGQDLGTPVIASLGCHSIAIGGQSSSVLTATLTRAASASCGSSLGPFTFEIRSRTSGDPSEYATSQGTKSFSFGPYQAPPPPPAGSTCTPVSGLGVPVILTPFDTQVFAVPPTSGPTQLQSVAVRWKENTDTGVPAPNNEWLVSQRRADVEGPTLTSTRTVTGTETSLSLQVPGRYVVTVGARNCALLGQQPPAPTRSVTFELRIQ